MPGETSSSGSSVPFALRSQAFAGALLDPEMEIPDGVGCNGSPAPRRFAVYRNNVVVSLMEAMGAAFPSIKAITGEENFARIARNYVSNHPPQSPMMQKFGSNFPEFLAAFPPLAKSPFLADIARAERAWLDAYHAADHEPLEAGELAGMSPEAAMELTFTPLPATRLIRSPYPVATLFDARNEWPRTGIDLTQGECLLITRPFLECIATTLDDPEAEFLERIFSGFNLGEAVSGAMELHDEFDPSAAIALLLRTGAVHGLQQPADIEQSQT